jgi:hypothetical protein
MGGGDEDPYDRNYRELILEASSLKWLIIH